MSSGNSIVNWWGGIFDPTSLGNLALWLDFSDASTLFDATSGGSTPANGGLIARVEDKSGNARHLTQATSARRPTYRTNQKNGLSIADFDGGDTLAHSTASTWTFLHDGTEYVIAAAFKPGNVADPNVAYALLATNNASSASHGMWTFWDDRSSVSRNDALVHECDRNATGQPSVRNISGNNLMAANQYGVMTIRARPSNATASNRSSIIVNEGAVVENNTFTNAPSAIAPLGPLTLGGLVDQTSFLLVGQLAEILIYTGGSATAEIAAAAATGLRNKWDI